MSKTNIEKAKESKTFCIYPWIHQYVGPMGDVKPCCIYTQEMELGTMKENTLKEIWNNDNTKQMRLDMLEGKTIAGCEVCDKRVGITKPYRDTVNEMYFYNSFRYYNMEHLVEATKEDGSLDEHQLYFLDARFNNLCNLKCRSCGPRFSSSWFEDHKKLGENYAMPSTAMVFPGKKESQLIEEILPHLEKVKSIYFAGGEPLMQIEHYQVLDELVRLNHTGSRAKPLGIYYNTNFSQLKLGKYSVLEYWNKFDRLDVNASIDGSYKRAEYWRKGTKWNTIVDNRKKVLEQCPNINFTVSYTLSWPNAFNLPEFHKEWTELGYIHVDNLRINFLDGPAYYCLKYIPKFKKQQIEEAFLKHIEWLETQQINNPHTIAQYREAIEFMNSVDTGDTFTQRKEFVHFNDLYDELRNEDFFGVFTEHVDMKPYIYTDE